eukprot:scaffold12941_cov120-Isochrysis_galbana.AAC.3
MAVSTATACEVAVHAIECVSQIRRSIGHPPTRTSPEAASRLHTCLFDGRAPHPPPHPSILTLSQGSPRSGPAAPYVRRIEMETRAGYA